uniref:Uncharacterized protein n=3 Tax=Klebsiella TaxID=570 RepID=A0A1Z3MLZ1_KLEOX|nr:hypothetical protein [Klebsiella oxytoca]AVX35400.1 Hypothetical protein [Klebsiella aerogenes]AXJ98595.1 hypothetical protein [Klebsiella pneumoniae]QAX88520.1 hypothetical protein [Klebsiella pneumoniae]QEQ68941.1 hypothetical protein [Klebsiella pneumoniae]
MLRANDHVFRAHHSSVFRMNRPNANNPVISKFVSEIPE